MNADVTKRSLNKSGRDAGAGAFALLVMSVLQEHIDLSVNEAMIALAVLTPIVTLFYRLARDHGLVLPTEVDDEPLPPEDRNDGGTMSGTTIITPTPTPFSPWVTTTIAPTTTTTVAQPNFIYPPLGNTGSSLPPEDTIG